ncbi:MAG: response regulator, partial [Xenococcaceae cyanobacterium MO_188.B29]|nr:response regulator [Xenococcaceae cyanobacterium MO_188.B29]
SSSTTEELLTMVDSFEEINSAVEEDLTIIQTSAEAEFDSSSSTTEELLTMVDSFEEINSAVEEDLTIIQTSAEAEFDSSSSTTEELLTMVDNFEEINSAVEEVEPTSELESRSAELSSISLMQELAIGNGSDVTSPMERILQSIFMGDWDTAAPKSQPTTSEKAPKSSSPPIKPPEALPTIRVTVQELDRLSHSIGELLISENQQHLQSDRIHRLTQDTLEQFLNCQQKLNQIHDWSDHNLLLSESKRRQQQRITNRQKNAIVSSSWTKSPQTLTIVEGIPSTDFQPEFDVLEMDVYSDLHLLLQNLTEQMMHLGEQIEALEGFAQNFRFNLGKRKQLLSGAQEDLLQARMLPLATVLNRFPRMLQQMVASHRKPAELKLIGSEVLIDKVVVEKLYDPLLHLIRNAYDHGLESSHIRRQQNKSEAGHITIRAYHQGNCTTIEVSDDGQGLNWGSIRTKAIAKQLLTREQAASASEAQLAELLFEPGFSTADKISQLSGRGIGLDVVRSQLQPLQGSISVNSVLGQGTTFVLKFPINLTSARLLICESQGIVYALLSEVIDRVLLPQPDRIQHQQSTIGQNQQTFLCWGEKLDQQLIPIDPLNNLIDYQYPTFCKEKSTSLSIFPVKSKNSVKPLLMLKHQQQRLCVQVDQILVEQELVIKSFGNTITLPNYIQGYSVLGDGSLTLVIDLAVLVTQTGETNFRANSLRQKFSNQTPAVLKPVVTVEEEQLTSTSEDESSQIFNRNQPSSKRVLVVDDSVVQRQTLTQHLTKANYKVLQAGNGQEALAQLNQHAEDIQLVICDVEMPYMNGFEFLSHWREDTRFAKIPVIMLTTRSGQKHRRLALALGAKVYFTKPYSNQELVETIAQLIKQP